MNTPRKGIKNYRAHSTSLSGYSQKIQFALSRIGAKRVFFEYGNAGELIGVGFIIGTVGGDLPVSLPARVDKVAQIMFGNNLDRLSENQKLQAYTTAWANIKDWVEAQCALIETEMVKTQEVFLPYMTTKDGKRFFEYIEENGYNQLGSGIPETGEIVK